MKNRHACKSIFDFKKARKQESNEKGKYKALSYKAQILLTVFWTSLEKKIKIKNLYK